MNKKKRDLFIISSLCILAVIFLVLSFILPNMKSTNSQQQNTNISENHNSNTSNGSKKTSNTDYSNKASIVNPGTNVNSMTGYPLSADYKDPQHTEKIQKVETINGKSVGFDIPKDWDKKVKIQSVSSNTLTFTYIVNNSNFPLLSIVWIPNEKWVDPSYGYQDYLHQIIQYGNDVYALQLPNESPEGLSSSPLYRDYVDTINKIQVLIESFKVNE